MRKICACIRGKSIGVASAGTILGSVILTEIAKRSADIQGIYTAASKYHNFQAARLVSITNEVVITPNKNVYSSFSKVF